MMAGSSHDEGSPLVVVPSGAGSRADDGGNGAKKEATDMAKSSLGWKIVACFALVFVQVSFSGYFVLTKVALNSNTNPRLFAFIRDTGGAITLQLATVATGNFCVPERHDLFTFAILGLTGVYFGQLLPIIALQHITALNLSLLQPVAPVLTFGVGAWLGLESLNWRRATGVAKIAGLLMAVVGAIVVVALGRSSDTTARHSTVSVRDFIIGNVFALMQVTCSAAFVLAQKPLFTRYKPLSVAAWMYTFGAGLVVLGILPCGTLTDPANWKLSASGVGAAVYAILVSSATNYALLSFGIKHTSPGLVTALTTLQPPATAVLAYLFLGQGVTLSSIIGGAAICLGLLTLVAGSALEWPGNRDGATGAGVGAGSNVGGVTNSSSSSSSSSSKAPARAPLIGGSTGRRKEDAFQV